MESTLLRSMISNTVNNCRIIYDLIQEEDRAKKQSVLKYEISLEVLSGTKNVSAVRPHMWFKNDSGDSYEYVDLYCEFDLPFETKELSEGTWLLASGYLVDDLTVGTRPPAVLSQAKIIQHQSNGQPPADCDSFSLDPVNKIFNYIYVDFGSTAARQTYKFTGSQTSFTIKTVGGPATLTIPDSYIGDMASIIISYQATGCRVEIESFAKVYQTETKFTLYSTGQVGNTNQQALNWQIPFTYLDYIPIGSSHVDAVLKCKTYDINDMFMGETETEFIVLMDVFADAPTLNPLIYDTDPLTVALTGNSSTLIKYYSDAYVDIRAEGKNGAAIVRQSISCGSVTVEQNKSTIPNVESGSFKVSATDEHGATRTSIINVPMIQYSKITCNVVGANIDGDGTLSFKVQGNYYNNSFGAQNNEIRIQYYYKESDSSNYISGNIITNPDLNGDNYSLEVEIEGLDYTKVYSYWAYASDKLGRADSIVQSVTGRPIFDWSKNDFNFNVPVGFANEKQIFGKTTNGEMLNAFAPCDSSNNLTIGYGGYSEEIGATKIYGNSIDLITNHTVTINGAPVGGAQTVLWSGALHMNDAQVVSLSESIESQPNGIVLVFSLYRNGQMEDVSINSFFVSKKEIELLPGAPHTFMMNINAGFGGFGAKYLYIYDTYIQGHESNTSSGNNSGVTFNNSQYVLRYVIGV